MNMVSWWTCRRHTWSFTVACTDRRTVYDYRSSVTVEKHAEVCWHLWPRTTSRNVDISFNTSKNLEELIVALKQMLERKSPASIMRLSIARTGGAGTFSRDQAVNTIEVGAVFSRLSNRPGWEQEAHNLLARYVKSLTSTPLSIGNVMHKSTFRKAAERLGFIWRLSIQLLFIRAFQTRIGCLDW